MSREIEAYGARAKVRRPLGTVGLTLITLGIYGIVWYHRVNSELRDYGRAYRDEDLAASNPTSSVLAIVPGFLLLGIPSLVSLFRFVGRVRRVERYGQSEMTSGWLVGAFTITLVFIPAIPGYVQSSLNGLWSRYPDAAPAKEQADGQTPEEASGLKRFWVWLIGPPRESSSPPEWIFQPAVGAVAFAISFVFTIVARNAGTSVLTGAAILAIAPQIVLAVQVFEDRRAQGLPYFWWSSAVGTLGSLVFMMYAQNRAESLANMQTVAGRSTATIVEAPSTPQGWYSDPWGLSHLRWWDGSEWTGYVTE